MKSLMIHRHNKLAIKNFAAEAITAILLFIAFLILISFRQDKDFTPILQKSSDNSLYLYQVQNDLFKADIGAKSSNTPTIFFENKNGGSVAMTLQDSVSKEILRQNNTVVFKNFQQNSDLSYTPLKNGIKEEIIINSKDTDPSYTFLIDTVNAKPRQINKDLYSRFFFDDKGKYQFHFEEPYAIDAKGNRTKDVSLSVRSSKNSPGRYQIQLSLSKSWLSDKNRSFPITIDPTIVYDTSSEFAQGILNRSFDTGSSSSPSIETIYQELPADENTVALWHMNEVSGNLTDSSGNGATATDNSTSVITGKINNGRSFNGSSSYALLSSSSYANVAGDNLTIEMWIKPAAFSAATIIHKEGQYSIGTDASGNITWADSSNYSYTGFGYQNIGLQLNKWQHLAVTKSGPVVRIYLDGELKFFQTFGGALTTTANTMSLGCYYSASVCSRYFNGSLDEVRISSIARTADEIKLDAQRRPYSTYTSPVFDLVSARMISWNSFVWNEIGVRTGDGETLKDSTSLVAQWNLNSTSGTTATNDAGSCGSSCNGTLTNFANTTAQDTTATGSGWTSIGRRWGAGALYFDGTDDYITCSDANCGTTAKLDPGTGAFSITAWIKTSNSTTRQMIVNKGDTNGQYAYSLEVNSGVIRFLLYTTTDTVYISGISPQKVSDGNWHYIVGTYDGTTISVYIDGLLSASSTTKSGSQVTDSTSSFNIGSRSASTYFNGALDSIAFFKRALTASEIVSNYNVANVNFQTRVGHTADPNDGTWEEWRPMTTEVQIDSFDDNGSSWSTDTFNNSTSTLLTSGYLNTGTGADGNCSISTTSANLNFESCSNRPTADAISYPLVNISSKSATIATYGVGLSAATPGRTCYTLKLAGRNIDGIYWIDPDGIGGKDPIQVACDMTRDGGGWTLGVKSYYLSDRTRMPDAMGIIQNALYHKNNSYKLDDDVIRAIIGPTNNFDVMGDQSGHNSAYSNGNFEYVIIRNYTGLWRWDQSVATSSTTTTFQSYRLSDSALAWTGNLSCGSNGAAGLNCYTVLSNNPQGGAGCTINMGLSTNSGWHHFFMQNTDSDTYLYICNGAQHSSGYDVNHRWWFREKNGAVADSAPVGLGIAAGDEVVLANMEGNSSDSESVGKFEHLIVSSITTTTNDGSTSNKAGRTCKSLKLDGQNTSGTYWIDPDGPGGIDPYQVYCDMTTDGGGWTRVVAYIAGDTSVCTSEALWKTLLETTRNWGVGGDVLATYFTSGAVRPTATPSSSIKFSPYAYNTINYQFSFPRAVTGWTYSASNSFNVRNVIGTNPYGNAAYWDNGNSLTNKANFCVGSPTSHFACIYTGTTVGNCGQIYHDGTWASSGRAVELYVREYDTFTDVLKTINFTTSVSQEYNIAQKSDRLGQNQSVIIQRVPNYQNVTLTPSGSIGSSAALAGKSCSSLYLDGVVADGTYWIDPDGSGGFQPYQVYCDMTTNGGGWTLVANIAPNDGNSVGFLNTAFWATPAEYGTYTNKFANDYKSPAAYQLPGNYLLIESTATGSAGAILGWRRWPMGTGANRNRTFASFFTPYRWESYGVPAVHATDYCETDASDAVSTGTTSTWDDIIRQGTCLYSDVNPSSSGEGDTIRLTTIPGNSTDNKMSGFASCIDCGLTWQGNGSLYMGLDRAGCNSTSCAYNAICRVPGGADCRGAYCAATYATTTCDIAWNSRFYIKDTNAVKDANLTIANWNGVIGGLLAFRATGTVTNNGAITVAGKGYRGGSKNPLYVNYSSGFAGERTSGYSLINDPSSLKYGIGGGPGRGGDGSGGGGANGTAGGNGSKTLAAAEGGYGGDPLTSLPSQRLIMGGGGGSGGSHDSTRFGPAGGNGGGILEIFADTLTNNATISANGNQGESGVILNSDANSGTAGGGGAGGSILIYANTASISGIFALGGQGGLKAPGSNGQNGGAGGMGKIEVNYFGSLTGTSTPSAQIFTPLTLSEIEGTSSGQIQTGELTADSGTVALYHLDETGGTGAYIKDKSGNNFHGTPTNTTSVPGVINRALSFNGSNSVVNIPANYKFDFTGDYTLEAWVRPNTVSTAQGIMGKNNVNGWGLNLNINSNSKFNFGSHNCSNFDGTTTAVPNQWYYVVGVYRANGTSEIYVNGELDGSFLGFTGGNCGSDTSSVVIGQYRDSSYTSNYFNGLIDEVRISNIARSGEEIAENFRMGAGKRLYKILSTPLDLSSKENLLFYIASDRPGTFIESAIGNSNYTSYLPDANTVGLWHLDDEEVMRKDYTFAEPVVDVSKWVIIDANNNKFSTSNGLVLTAGTTAAWDSAVISTQSFTNQSGVTLYASYTTGSTVGDMMIGFGQNQYASASYTVISHALYFTGGGNLQVYQDGTLIGTYGSGFAANTTYEVIIYLNPSGTASYYIKGGAYTTWTALLAADNAKGTGYNKWRVQVSTYQAAGKFNKISVTSPMVKDYSGKGNHGVFTSLWTNNNYTNIVPGKIGNAKFFNGVNDVLQVDTSPSLQITGPLTIEAWVNSTASAAYRGIAGKMGMGSGYYSYLLRESASGYANFFVSSNGTGGTEVIGNTIINDGNWHYLVGTYSPSTFLKIYVDGKLQNQVTSSVPALIYNSHANFSIGCSYTTQSECLAGTIDEVRVSNIVRTDDEIRQAFDAGRRTHKITIDFAAYLDSGDLVNDQYDTSFTVDATQFGLNQKGSNIYSGDKIIIKENYDGTTYIAQGRVNGVTASTGAITVSSWDTNSTFPPSDFTTSANVFKWQREYFPIYNSGLAAHIGSITNLNFRITNGNEGRTIWIDDLRYSGESLTTPAGSSITSSLDNRYIQYKAILSSEDYSNTATISAVTLDYTANSAPGTPTLDSPTNTAISQTITPSLKTTATDTNSDYLKYKIVLCEDALMSTYCQTFDQTSSQTGWSGQNAAGNTAYTSGTQATYTVQTPLSYNKTYYWKSYAIDSAGSEIWSGTQVSPYSFTTNQTPNVPTLDSPSPAATSVLLYPSLKTTATDIDSDYLRYKIELCTNPSMTVDCQTFDQTSSQTGWSGQNAAGNTAYTSGTQATYTLQTQLLPNTQYYWRSYSIDPAGANSWSGTQSPSRLFTTNQVPNTASLDSPANNSTGVSTVTTFRTTPTDPDNNSMKMKIIICTDVNMTYNCQTFDQTSSQTGWSGQNAVGNTEYSSGTQATYIAQTPLNPGTIYFWKSYAVDPSGTNIWSGTQSTPYKFTTITAPENPSACTVTKNVTNTQIALNWLDIATTEIGYQIWKVTDGGAPVHITPDLAANSVTYTDTSVSTNHSYGYLIRSFQYDGTNTLYSDWCATPSTFLGTGSFQFSGVRLDGLRIQ